MVVSVLSDYTVILFPQSYLNQSEGLAGHFLDLLVATAQISSTRVANFRCNHGVPEMDKHVASAAAGI
ncbi:hypothetical protein [Janthinobacterium sp.]|uniref:hypothetical protein n=1 Tax=Janthinobacterium sp. TaxID=1871054 RepID=UPI00289DE164|nr:hypothetical protein [Janthinobacterium sp.]